MDAIEAAVDLNLLRRLDPLSSMAEEQLEELAGHARRRSLQQGACVFHAGDPERQAVYLLSGSVHIAPMEGEAYTVTAGSERARRPLAREIPRRSTAMAAAPVELLYLDSDLLDTLLAWGQIAYPETEVIMSQDGVMTIDKGSWLRKMLTSPTFNKLPPANVEQLLERLEPIKVGAGDVIIRQGDAGDYFYMINDGIALVSRQLDEEGDDMELAELKDGDSFGESALISAKPRNATITMMTDGVLLRLSKDDFVKLLQEPTLRWIAFEEAQREVAAGGRWLDVRLPSEYGHGHLPGAVNVPMGDLHKRSNDLDRGPTYVCCCDSGRRSSAAAFVLSQYGLKACVLKDGIQAARAALVSD